LREENDENAYAIHEAQRAKNERGEG